MKRTSVFFSFEPRNTILSSSLDGVFQVLRVGGEAHESSGNKEFPQVRDLIPT